MKDYSNSPTTVLIRFAVKRGMARSEAEKATRERLIAFLEGRK